MGWKRCKFCKSVFFDPRNNKKEYCSTLCRIRAESNRRTFIKLLDNKKVINIKGGK